MPKTDNDKENSSLLPCPFCGGKAYIKEKVRDRGYNLTGKIPPGAVLVHVDEQDILMNGSVRHRERYAWEKMGYIPHCNGERCICRIIAVVFKSEQEAVDAWNKRSLC